MIFRDDFLLIMIGVYTTATVGAEIHHRDLSIDTPLGVFIFAVAEKIRLAGVIRDYNLRFYYLAIVYGSQSLHENRIPEDHSI